MTVADNGWQRHAVVCTAERIEPWPPRKTGRGCRFRAVRLRGDGFDGKRRALGIAWGTASASVRVTVPACLYAKPIWQRT